MSLTAEQLAFELEQVQQGNCWIGNNAMQILDGIDWEFALFRAFEDGNSIWQIVNHISHWREVVLRRLLFSKTKEDEISGMDEPAQPSENAWQETLNRFQQSFEKLEAAIRKFPEEKLEASAGNTSYRSTIIGLIEHDAYHLGQVILLKKMRNYVKSNL